MKRGLKWVLYGLVVVVLAVVLGTVLPRPLLPRPASAAGAGSTRILVLSGPIHTDIAVPLTDDVRARFGFVEAAGVPIAHPRAQWLIFGWGGRSFYLETPTWSELKPMPVLKALTLDRSVMHVDIAGRIVEPQAAVAGFELDQAGLERMLAFISNSFARDAGTVVPVEGFSYNGNDRFFDAEGSFNALLGCNTWTARALREAGLRTGLWNPVPPSLGLSLHMLN